MALLQNNNLQNHLGKLKRTAIKIAYCRLLFSKYVEVSKMLTNYFVLTEKICNVNKHSKISIIIQSTTLQVTHPQ